MAYHLWALQLLRAGLRRPEQTLYSESDADNSQPFGHHDAALACAQDRDWPQPMAALAVALPVGAVGASLMTAGMVSDRLRRLERDLGRARK